MSLLTPPFTHKIFFSLNPSRGNRSSTWKLQTWVSFKLGWTFVMPAGFPNPGAVFQLHEAQCSRDFFPRDLCFSRKPQWRWDCLRDEKSLCAGTDQPEVAASPNLRKQVAAPPSSVLTLIAGAVQGTPLSPMRFARHPEIGMHGGSFPAALKLTQEDAFSSPCWVSSAVLLYFCLIIFVVSLSFYFCCIFFVLLFLLYSCLFIFLNSCLFFVVFLSCYFYCVFLSGSDLRRRFLAVPQRSGRRNGCSGCSGWRSPTRGCDAGCLQSRCGRPGACQWASNCASCS